jgi:hypothetical protein
MRYGVIDMIAPEECEVRRFIRPMTTDKPLAAPLDADELLRDVLQEGGLA